MADSLTFAHVTDIHLTEAGESWGTLDDLAEDLFARVVETFNRMDGLDFVLITGDVVDTASPAEVDRFRELIAPLEVPWHFIPGNHDGYYDPKVPSALPPHEAVSRLDPRLADPPPIPQQARWSRPVAADVQLIGLESRIADDWGGVIDAGQMAWLRAELEAHRGDDLVIVAVHHPLHMLTPLNKEEWWCNFVCSNGPEVEALLDEFPNARLVISGHHHASQIVQRPNGRLHVVTAALSGYPCVYRLIRLTREDGAWYIRVETHSPANEAERRRAYDRLITGKTAQKYNSTDPTAWARFVEGRPEDRFFEGRLG